ncbi:LSU ribosomal protein L4p (L1e) [hydrothermal vent metagenome]|uniref:LSU ribosomal protein L4p (L1e) n=1 Tax=hydrothermal vent metagenome TaxID=652676 RepID=A0A160VAA5_9ZZZZ|tara:strand:+ start:2064 stop:3017 length:954 start_codon:yes stop_codon:yes gene_type:complete
MQVSVKNQNGDALDSIELSDAVFNVPMNQSLVHQAMVIYQGNKRQGTHDTKTRAQVSGGGRKPWIQKHTGRARQGSTRAPQWRHGGVVFGPHPRSYRAALPKRMKRQALRCVLSEKVRQDRLVCLDSTDTIDGKTKSMAQLLANLQVGGSALVITKATDKTLVQAAHNLEKIWTLPANQLNAQELLAKDLVIMTVEAARWVEEIYSNEPHGRRGAKWTNGSPVAGTAEPEAVADSVPESVVEETEVPAEEDAPKPVRRRAAAKPGATAGTATETSGDAPAEEALKPRTRRRRTAASTSDEPTSETAIPDADTPEEEA